MERIPIAYRKVIHDGYSHIFHEFNLCRTKTCFSGLIVEDAENSNVVAVR
jgi:hypothetical protein